MLSHLRAGRSLAGHRAKRCWRVKRSRWRPAATGRCARTERGQRGGIRMAYDLLIRNGRVVDGSGEPAFAADVAVQDGKIVGVGKYAGAAAKRTIDAEGRVVAPGFIDHHTHFDPQAVWDPYCGSWVHNRHTTVIVRQCGQVIAPGRPGDGEWCLEFFSEAEAIPLSGLIDGVDVAW